ncbi:Sodium/hydrogen exchanger family-domain-containing protein [Lyophyllum atratum]|nr:Sodium/hydrogen exchanger family-domain-containing protein [Lyophyllum atratum]
MAFNPFEVTIPHIAYACLGGFVVLFGMFSLFLREKLYIGEACWAFLFGVIIGPYGAGIFDPHHWGGASEEVTNTITLEFTRVVLAIGVFAIGVELPKAYMARHWKSLFFLLVPVMTWGWFVSAGLIYALIPGLNFLSSLAVAACLTPTDPILAAAVVGGKWADKHVPAHIRHLLAAESGCNDGAAFPFLFIALYLLLDAPDTGAAIRDWFLLLWLYQVIMGIVIGALLGLTFRYLMKFCQRHNLIDRHSYVAQYLSLAMLTIGITTLLGSDDLLAAFACGTAFAWDGFFNRQTEESVFSSVIDLLFNVAAFVYVGAWMPFGSFQDEELGLSVWRLVVIAICVFLLRRLPAVVALYKWIPDIKTFREAIFSGHFGPIGIGAVFISTLANETITKSTHARHTSTPQLLLLAHSIQPIVAFMVLCSILIHGLSIPSFSLGRRVHSVSRTWSRHASISGGAPDWTMQARRVERGAEDIVINRDLERDLERGEMERGEVGALGEVGEGKVPESRTLTSRAGTLEKDRGSFASEKEVREKDLGEMREGRPDTPPDGRAGDVEWREGRHHTVIEHQDRPGEDVEVEVLKDEDSSTPSLPEQIRKSLHLLDGLKRSVGHLHDHLGQPVGHQVAEVQRVLSNTSTTPGPSTTTTTSRGEEEDGEEEGGWTSESPSEKGSATTTTKRRGVKMKPTRSQPLGSLSRKGRQRGSIRRGHPPPPAIQTQDQTETPGSSTPTPPDESESERRGRGRSHDVAHPHFEAGEGRRYPHPHQQRPGTAPSTYTRTRTHRPGTADSLTSTLRPGTADSSLRNHRVSHIRLMHSSPPTREVSPSRSVRFMDEAPRGGGGGGAGNGGGEGVGEGAEGGRPGSGYGGSGNGGGRT